MGTFRDGGLAIRAATRADAARVASLHATEIADGFLSFLGPAFLHRLYDRIVRSPHAFLLVADASSPVGSRTSTAGPLESATAPEASAIVGFIAGATEVGALYRSFLVHDGAKAALAAAPRLVRSWRRAFETLGHGRGGAGGGQGAELLSIAVDPDGRGKGVGGRLVDAFLSEVGRRGLAAAHVVVAASNGPAVALYRDAGFAEVIRFELHPGTESLVMQWDDR